VKPQTVGAVTLTKGPNQLVLHALWFEHNYSTFALAAVTTGVTVFTILYVQNASMAMNPDTRLLLDTPDTNVFRLTLLATITLLLLKALTNSICEDLGWSKGRAKESLSVLGFLTLTVSTESPLKLLRILTMGGLENRNSKSCT
jgi:hypothetical protein